MVISTEQTNLATSTKTRTCHDKMDFEDSVSFLSQTRKETKISKLSRQNDKAETSEPNQTSLKMVKRLEPIAVLLSSLPKPLAKQTSEFASFLLSHAIEVRH